MRPPMDGSTVLITGVSSISGLTLCSWDDVAIVLGRPSVPRAPRPRRSVVEKESRITPVPFLRQRIRDRCYRIRLAAQLLEPSGVQVLGWLRHKRV